MPMINLRFDTEKDMEVIWDCYSILEYRYYFLYEIDEAQI